jgi:outer membrane protein TolC
MRALTILPFLTVFLLGSTAAAQVAPQGAPKPAPAPVTPQPAAAQPAAAAPQLTGVPTEPVQLDRIEDVAKLLGDAPQEMLRVESNGLKSTQVAKRAAETNYSAKASMAALEAADARRRAAWDNFLPRVSVLGRYTRLSELTPPPFVIEGAGPGGTDLTFSNPFPVILDNWVFQGTLTVPLSDYLLRINQGYSAATEAREAARWDTVAAKAKAASDGKLAYYVWLRARGTQLVAELALADQKQRKKDVEAQFNVGNASKVDVLRVDTAVAAAELGVEQAKNLGIVAEAQVRVAMHAPTAEVFMPGENILEGTAPFPGNVDEMVREALTTRPELKSLSANVEAIHHQGNIARAGYWPQFAGVANLNVNNPNQRKFPLEQTFFPTWDLSLQLTWSPNDLLVGVHQGKDADAKVAQLEAQKAAFEDGIRIEVTQTFTSLKEAEFAVGSSVKQLAAAREAYRVGRELFQNGRATASTISDADFELNRARIQLLDAVIGVRVARVRLEHALGRDTRDFVSP